MEAGVSYALSALRIAIIDIVASVKASGRKVHPHRLAAVIAPDHPKLSHKRIADELRLEAARQRVPIAE